MAGSAIEAFGNAEQKQALLPPMARGEIEACIAYTEVQAGSDLAALTTTALPVDGGFVLNGHKALITGGHKADWCVTIALTDRDAPPRQSMTMFVLPTTTPGLHRTRRVTANQWTLSEFTFTDARVPATAVLGAVGRGWQQVTSALADERSGMAHLGWATLLHEQLVDWARPAR